MKHRIDGVPQLDNPLADIACNHFSEGGVCLWFILYRSQITVRIPCPIPAAD